MSLQAMASELGVSVATVSRIEKREQNISLELIKRIHQVTSAAGQPVTPNDLVELKR